MIMETEPPQTSDNQSNVGVMLQSDSDKVCKYLERSCSSSKAVAQSPSGTNPRLAVHQLQNFVDESSMNKEATAIITGRNSQMGWAGCLLKILLHNHRN